MILNRDRVRSYPILNGVKYMRYPEKEQAIKEIEEYWNSPRWAGITRPYTPEDVWKIRGTVKIEYTLAKMGAEKFWRLLNEEPYIQALGALTGLQAVQMVQAGLKAIYVSGWQVAADMNDARETYPDQSLYPADSAIHLVERINKAFQRMDQIQHMEFAEGKKRHPIDWFVPIVADGEAGFGGPLNVFEFMKAMIRAGVAGVHFEDQLSAHKKCGHLGGKVLVPTRLFIQTLISARLASDVLGVPTILIARTDANSAKLLTSDIDPVDQDFIVGNERTYEGFFRFKGGLEACIARGLAYAPYADLLWFETSNPDLEEAQMFAEAIHAKFPGKMLAYNCSPSFNWKKMAPVVAENFQEELGALGYKFQFVTLAGFHQLNYGMWKLATEYRKEGMFAYQRLQSKEFKAETEGYRAIKHQSFVGTGYFDLVSDIISQGQSSTKALDESTETDQFH